MQKVFVVIEELNVQVEQFHIKENTAMASWLESQNESRQRNGWLTQAVRCGIQFPGRLDERCSVRLVDKSNTGAWSMRDRETDVVIFGAKTIESSEVH